jgi:hypothetical protein
MVFTLLGNGFSVDTVRTGPGYALTECSRYDEFGVPTYYVFVLPQTRLASPSARAIARHATERGAYTVVIADELPEDRLGMDWPTFQARLGGPIKAWLPLEPSFAADLDALGHNQPIAGVEGRPDELFEEYVHVALQFLLESRVIRYGQKRRGQALPDGVGLGRNGPTLLYDAKAYENGYAVTLDSVRQFSSYVRDFNRKYEHYVERVHAFLVVSGHSAAEPRTLEDKSNQMYSECGVRLAFLTAPELGAAVQLLAKSPTHRRSVNWREVFGRTIVTASDVQRSLAAALEDQVIRPER